MAVSTDSGLCSGDSANGRSCCYQECQWSSHKTFSSSGHRQPLPWASFPPQSPGLGGLLYVFLCWEGWRWHLVSVPVARGGPWKLIPGWEWKGVLPSIFPYCGARLLRGFVSLTCMSHLWFWFEQCRPRGDHVLVPHNFVLNSQGLNTLPKWKGYAQQKWTLSRDWILMWLLQCVLLSKGAAERNWGTPREISL